MKQVLISAHNPMTGPRHLGHYVSTMIDWPRLQDEYELFLVIDDLIASVLYPRGRADVQKWSFLAAREFLATGVSSDRCRIVLTSMLPELHELCVFTGLAIDHSWCATLHGESFSGRLTSYNRRELHMPKLASVTEVVYPQLALATLTVGLRAAGFQGGEEMRGYLPIIEEICEGLGSRTGLTPPKFLTTNCSFLLGNDGQHMGTDNAIFLSASEKELAEVIGQVNSSNVLAHWYEVLGHSERAKAAADKSLTADARAEMTGFLTDALSRFRDFRVKNEDIVQLLQKSAGEARGLLRDSLITIKRQYHVPGFA